MFYHDLPFSHKAYELQLPYTSTQCAFLPVHSGADQLEKQWLPVPCAGGSPAAISNQILALSGDWSVVNFLYLDLSCPQISLSAIPYLLNAYCFIICLNEKLHYIKTCLYFHTAFLYERQYANTYVFI